MKAMKKKVSYEMLKKFCSESQILRPALHEPHHGDGEWVASNCKCILVVDENWCKRGIQKRVDISVKENKLEMGRYPDYKSIIDRSKVMPVLELDIEELEAAIEKCDKMEEVVEEPTENELEECPACYGTGEIDPDDVYFRGHYYSVPSCECPICHGHGKVPVSPDFDPEMDDDPEQFEATVLVKTGRMITLPLYPMEIMSHEFYARDMIMLRDYMRECGIKKAGVTYNGQFIVFVFDHSVLLFGGIHRDEEDLEETKAVHINARKI